MKKVIKMFSIAIVMFLVLGVSKTYADITFRVTYKNQVSNDYSVSDSATILDVKNLIKEKYGIEVENQYLTLGNQNNTVLENDKLLSSYDLSNNILVLKNAITTEKVFNVKSIEPDDNNYFAIFEDIEINNDINIQNCNETYTKCSATDFSGNYYPNVTINYIYDKNTKKVVDSIVSKLEERVYNVSDLEIISYWLNGGSILYYSNDLMSTLGYKNFENFSFDVRAGDNSSFNTVEVGILKFIYNDTIYFMADFVEVDGNNIIYVEDNTDSNDLMKSAQTRIDNYFGKDKVKLVDTGNLEEFLDSYVLDNQDIIDEMYEYNESMKNLPGYVAKTKEEIANQLKEEMRSMVSDILKENEHIYKVIIGDNTYYTLIRSDSSKMVETTYRTSDILTDVSISSSNKTIPYDALVNVRKITDGETYKKILDILKLTDSEMYDLKLFSKSLDNYVSKLVNGSFEVRIPIKDEYKNKNLVAYYVDDNGKVTEYEVTVKDGYAIFNTDHFSIYTLGVKNVNNPQTGDNIINSVILAFVSIICLSGIGIYFYKNKRS